VERGNGGKGLSLRACWLFSSSGSAPILYAGSAGQCVATLSGKSMCFICPPVRVLRIDEFNSVIVIDIAIELRKK
jgi:hypothetical protein